MAEKQALPDPIWIKDGQIILHKVRFRKPHYSAGKINKIWYAQLNISRGVRKKISTQTTNLKEAEVDQIVTQAMFLKPRAFNEKFFGGKTAPDKLKYLTGSLNRAIAKQQAQPRRRVLKTRKDFLEFYQDQFNFFNPSKTGKMGSFLNKTMTKNLTRKR